MNNNLRFWGQKLLICLILSACMLPQRVHAQFNMLFTSDTDLPNCLVNKIAEDRLGVIWVATENGLSRYNGSHFVNYHHIKNNPNSLAHNFARTVYTDTLGNIIVGTCEGVQLFRKGTDDFTPVISTQSIGLPHANVNIICSIKEGEYFVGGSYAYTLAIDKKGNATVKRNALTNKITDIQRVVCMNDGTILAARQSDGVVMADKKGRITHLRNYDGSEYNIASFCKGHDGTIYAANVGSGIYVFNAKTKHFDMIKGTESMEKIRDVKAMPNSSRLCIATDGDGVFFFDTRSRQIVPSNNFNDPFINISTQKVHSICINKDGDIWMALYQKGIFMASHSSAPFGYVGKRSQMNDLIGDHCVNSIVQSRNGDIWVSTDNGGIYGFTSSLSQIRKFPISKAPDGIPSTVQGIFLDSRDRLWFGSYNMGCGIVDKQTGKCTYIPIEGVNGKAFSVFGFGEDKRGNIFAATMGNGLMIYDEARKEFVKFTDKNGLTWSNTIFYDRYNDVMYVGTYNGIVYFSPTDKKKSTHVLESSAIIYGMTQLSPTTLGIASTEGLILYDTKSHKIKKLTEAQGLPSNNVLAVENGVNGHIWLSTSNGLVRVNLKNMAIETFSVRDGLQGNEFYKNASLKSMDGRLWFGGINGITYFTPGRIFSKNIKCTVRVVNLSSGERNIFRDEDDKYALPSSASSFTVELATLPVCMTHRVVYNYRLDDGEWQILPLPQNSVTFNNIGYGSHTLYTKTTVDGRDSQVTTTIIYIEYPWYLKWWAILLWLIIIAVAAYYLSVELKKRTTMRKQMAEHEREEELKETKLQFFMNVVHDLRTPITLISTPLQKLMTTDNNGAHQRIYNLMNRNADRLLRLTDQIMDLRKIDRGKMELSCVNVALSPFIKNLVNYMEDLAQSRRQELKVIDNTDGNAHVMLDIDCVEKIIFNLLSNAIKYTPENGRVTVEMTLQEESLASNPSTLTSNLLNIKVTDTGIGIPDDEKKKIFTRFYQVKSNGKHVKGTGIGLNLVHALVELCHGTISVTDNPEGNGTCFTIEMPVEMAQGEPETQTSMTENQRVEEVETLNSTPSTLTSNLSTLTSNPSALTPNPQPLTPNSTSKEARRKTILIVDDDDEIRSFLCEEMAVTYNVIDCANGKTAYEVLTREPVDLVISDIMMPEVDGIELLRMIRENVRMVHLPVILLTAKVSDQDRIEGLQANADAYVTKPFNLQLLQTLVVNLLLKQDMLRTAYKGTILPTEEIETPKIESPDDKLMKRLVRVINENIDNPDLTSEFLASEVGLSRVHLYRKLKELTNQSATSYIRNIRLTKAAELLRMRKGNISEISYRLGFRTPNHFSTAFKELYGVSPSEYIKSVHTDS